MKLDMIKDNKEFQLVYTRGYSIVGAFIVMYKFKNTSGKKRFGITVSKKVGKAVQRNRVRRLIRVAIVNHYQKFENRYDYVIVARVRAKDAKLIDIEKNMRYLLAKSREKRKK